jgi:hypothetical protein
MRKVALLAVMSLLAAVLSSGVAMAGPVTGYEVVTSPPLAFGDGGFGGWSCPAGKVVLGGGFEGTRPVAVSAPGTPGSVWPHYTFGPAESGWVVRDDPDGAGNTIVVYAVCADPPSGYEVVTSPAMAFGDGGFAGWSCPAGKDVLGGGFEGTDTVAVSAPGTPGSVWPHYTFGPAESGWVVRDAQNGAGQTAAVYAICAEPVPGYAVVESSLLSYGDGGFAGWSCPADTAVSGGGFEGTRPMAVSAPGTPGSAWPHYTFGPGESGWVVRDAQDGAGQTATVHAVCFLGGSRQREKEAVVDSLEALLPTGNSTHDARIEVAIERVENSLTPGWWVDEDTVTAEDGDRVFNEQKIAVRELSKRDIVGNPDTDALIRVIVGIDRALAAKAIADAEAGSGDQEEIDKANALLAEGDLKRDALKFDQAIELYKRAWEHAQQAI